MRKITYLAVMEPSEDGGYAVFFPDVPGCISYGESFEKARAMAEEAVGLHVYALDKMLDIKQGFLLNELYHAMDGHILEQCTLKGIYEN